MTQQRCGHVVYPGTVPRLGINTLWYGYSIYVRRVRRMDTWVDVVGRTSKYISKSPKYLLSYVM